MTHKFMGDLLGDGSELARAQAERKPVWFRDKRVRCRQIVHLLHVMIRNLYYERHQARTQDFAQEGATCSRRGTQVTRGPPWRLGAQETRGHRMTAGAHWVIRCPSGNQGYMNAEVGIATKIWKPLPLPSAT